MWYTNTHLNKTDKIGSKKMKLAAQTWICVLYLWQLITPSAAAAAAAAENTTSYARPGCNDVCGDVQVPYPFGIDELSCAKNKTFFLVCNRSLSPPKLYGDDAFQTPIISISKEDSIAVVGTEAAVHCHDGTGQNHYSPRMELELSGPLTISNTRNKFTAVGCDALAYMVDNEVSRVSGCVSLCDKPDDNLANGSTCFSTAGCCQTSIPRHLQVLSIDISSSINSTNMTISNPCSYAFLLDTHSNFSISNDISTTGNPNTNPIAPVAIEWIISRQPECEDQCSLNAECVHSENALGYRCSCKDGYMGNPYLPQGCQDIDECKNNPCQGSCKNTEGSYICKCPIGMKSDGKDSCQQSSAATIAAVVGSITFSVIISLLIFIMCKKRRKQNNFMKNGGELLKNQRMRIFTEAELEKATRGYDNDQLLGKGGCGYVYKGVLEGNIQVAVKKPKSENKIEMSQDFLHEIATVSQVNHKNVVKLLGLCLETKVPLLVYEFISNGTLFQHIHDKTSRLLRSWKNRLRVAAETALALDYLHSLADPPIIHRDIKSMNILLDDNYTAKVSDFGASVLVSPEKLALATNIQGTLGYLDPEYLMTGNLTEKSDVYSFGVLLVELLTGEKPTSNSRSGEKRNIIQYFISTAENNDMFETLGFDVTDESEREEIEEVADIARRCLNPSGIRRPAMKEVAEDLARLKKHNENFWAQQSGTEETEKLIGESSSYFGGKGKPDSYIFDIE